MFLGIYCNGIYMTYTYTTGTIIQYAGMRWYECINCLLARSYDILILMNSLLSKTIGNIGSHILRKCVETTSAVPALCLSFRLRRWRINLEGGLVKIVANKEGWVFTFKS